MRDRLSRLSILLLVPLILSAILLPAVSPSYAAGTAAMAQGAGPVGQVLPVPCIGTVPGPGPTAELRLVRDAQGNYWQIQSGCRHLVVPFVLDSDTMQAIPRGEDVSFISFGLIAPAPVPPLTYPSYAQVPTWLLPPASTSPTPPASPAAEGVLIVDIAQPNVVYLVAGGLRHRVLVYYPLDVPADEIDPSRLGAEASYRLRGSQNGVQFFVPTIGVIPLGDSAPYYSWARGESVVVSDQPTAPAARLCGSTEQQCSPRFREAQTVSQAAYAKDPGAFAGTDLRVQGLACAVRYDRARGVTTFSLGGGLEAVAPGQAPGLEDFASVIAGVSVSPPPGGGSGPGQLVVFEYMVVRPGGGTLCGSATGR